jgi:5-methylcytosine-specific restriction endonuclease McrA
MKGVWLIHCNVCGLTGVAGPPHGTTCLACLEAGLKWCSSCHSIKSTADFYVRPDSGGLMSLCADCYKHKRNTSLKTDEFKEAKRVASRKCKQLKYATTNGRLKEIARCHERRAALTGTYTPEEWLNCLDFFSCSCAYCGEVHALTVDHITALSKGGPNTISNIVPACSRCNSSKNASEIVSWFTNQSFYEQIRLQRILEWVRLMRR